eukprot:CAMPEP_0174695838 /NCGR_PEP_ID=MMETSP1094-20130205/2135_1 /TAXON_ID=156173 /ORGANISM="Chrysochromulina brevifilum, Strain UTEX LB 985" /LENGTH=124 /DNA_ID=CAMNT_0015892447 /DNA_START=240 /DNA_END=614 /DNA_ORIENTATION=+
MAAATVEAVKAKALTAKAVKRRLQLYAKMVKAKAAEAEVKLKVEGDGGGGIEGGGESNGGDGDCGGSGAESGGGVEAVNVECSRCNGGSKRRQQDLLESLLAGQLVEDPQQRSSIDPAIDCTAN